MADVIIEQEAKNGLKLFRITEGLYMEVSEFKGKTRVDMRRWYEKPDGSWARTNKGLNITLEEWNDLVSCFEDMKTQVQGFSKA